VHDVDVALCCGSDLLASMAMPGIWDQKVLFVFHSSFALFSPLPSPLFSRLFRAHSQLLDELLSEFYVIVIPRVGRFGLHSVFFFYIFPLFVMRLQRRSPLRRKRPAVAETSSKDCNCELRRRCRHSTQRTLLHHGDIHPSNTCLLLVTAPCFSLRSAACALLWPGATTCFGGKID
jgi:hypothetical protein